MAKKTKKKNIAVFIASPGDLAQERRIFRQEIDILNDGFGDGANVIFEPLGWEDTLASTGRRSQSVINREIDQCDVFILVMHRRWGQPAPDAKPFSSYTEEEFHRALDRFNKEGKPEIFVFFKRVDAGQEADPGPQLEKVLEFRRHLEETRQVLYHYIDDDGEHSFDKEIHKHLRAYAKGELPGKDSTRDLIVLPLSALDEVKKAREETAKQIKAVEKARKERDIERLKNESYQLESAEDAAKMALEGRVEHARQKFVKLVPDTSNLRILFLACQFFHRTGDLETAEEILKKWLQLSGPEKKSYDTAAAYGNLGNIYRTQGDLDQAEQMHKKALAIEEALGRKEGMAADYGNLGLIYQIRGDLKEAEQMLQKALALNEALGRKEGMAIQYGNLGLIYQTRGDLKEAVQMHQKALALNEALRRKEGMAADYGNLGLIYQTRGDLKEAEQMLQKALALNEALGRKEGMAANYGNLGLIYRDRGDLDQADQMLKKSLTINEALNYKEGMAIQYNNLGLIYQDRGDLNQAKEMYQKAIKLFESIGSPNAESVRQSLSDLNDDNKSDPDSSKPQ